MKRFVICLYFLIFFSLSLFVSGVIESQDGLQYLAVARNIFYNHEPIAPQYQSTGSTGGGKNIHLSTFVGRDGKTYSPTGIGYSLALIPAVAMSDIIYKQKDYTPLEHFPLESDWLITTLASFTNIFFAALLGIILYLYLIELKLKPKQALLISVVSLFTTNLFILAKDSFAHMMFISFLFLAFYLLKKYSQSGKNILLLFSGISYGAVIISYNPTFLLTIPAYCLYYLLLLKPKIQLISLRKIFKDLAIFVLGTLPFILLYIWYENIRSGANFSNFSSPIIIAKYGTGVFKSLPISLFFEGIYGHLLSPGRSIFLYSPILLIIIFFWHKIKKQIKPELFVFILISTIYIVFFATQRAFEPDYAKYVSLWHGELSWGPRYLSPLIPFGILIVGHIYTSLTKLSKLTVFLPLLLVGLFIELIGVFIPYQSKLSNLDRDIVVSGYHYTMFTYPSFLPQLSPIFTTSNKFINMISYLPKTFNHGLYNVKLYDGIDLPFNMGTSRWRVIDGKGFISFDNSSLKPIQQIAIRLINQPRKEASEAAKINITINNNQLLEKPYNLLPGQDHTFKFDIPSSSLLAKNNNLVIDTNFIETGAFNKYLIALLGLNINSQSINLETLDIPYVQTLGDFSDKLSYNNYGKINTNPWKYWILHAEIFERGPDLWWVRNWYYWDLPHQIFLICFLLTVGLTGFFGYYTYKNIPK